MCIYSSFSNAFSVTKSTYRRMKAGHVNDNLERMWKKKIAA
jgi:hypothetical protein